MAMAWDPRILYFYIFLIGGGMSFEVSVRAKLAAAFDKGMLKLTSWIRLLYGLRLSQATQTA